jgi:hypothetical protein
VTSTDSKLKLYKEKEMVDFRRMIPVLAVLAFLLGSAVTANAQPALSCVTAGGVNTPVRAEGLTELVGDFIVTCTGGTSTAYGAAIPTVNIQIFISGTSITSRLMGSSTTLPQWSEALLLLDEPVPGAQYGCIGAATTTTACYTPGGVQALGTGSGAASVSYGSGTLGTVGNTRNVYQGVQTASNAVTFLGIPVDPPGTSGQRILRITNIRVNANALGVSAVNQTPVSVFATMTATPFNLLPLSNLATQAVGSVQRGLNFSISPTNTSLQQCVSRGTSGGPITTLRYQELFATAFKRRMLATSSASPLAFADQNNLNPLFAGTLNTESGFVNSALAIPAPTAPNGRFAGEADWGTRLRAVFNNVPAGVSLFVQTQSPVPASTDTALLTASETAPFSAVPNTAGAPSAAQPVGGSTQISLSNNSGTAVWEVLDSNPNSLITLNFAVWATYTANPGANSPALGTATVNGGYAPVSTVTTAINNTIPRFADTSTPLNVFTVVPCVTNLLFPYVTTAAGFDTGLAISATATDPWGTSAQSGTCTLNYYGAAGTLNVTTPVVTSGTTHARLASGDLSSITGGWSGYMIAVCRFQFAHGFAFISDIGARNLAMGYLALVIPDIPRNPAPFPCGGTGSGNALALTNCIASGEQLGF